MALTAKVRTDFSPMTAFVNQVNMKMFNWYNRAGTLIRNEAKDLASRKAGGGRWYTVKRTRTKKVEGQKVTYRENYRYQASAPGEPPVKVTGALWGSIHYYVAVISKTPLGLVVYRAYIGSPSKISTYLEFGTRRMLPRPFLRPALMNKLEELRKALEV